jgi:hypothetical protein
MQNVYLLFKISLMFPHYFERRAYYNSIILASFSNPSCMSKHLCEKKFNFGISLNRL